MILAAILGKYILSFEKQIKIKTGFKLIVNRHKINSHHNFFSFMIFDFYGSIEFGSNLQSLKKYNLK